MNIKSKLASRPLIAAIAGGAVALLLAGGTATAAATIGSEDIKDDSILRKDLSQDHVMFDIDNVFWNELAGRIKPDINQVWTSEIINGTILPEDLSDEAKTELQGNKGDDGADGTDGKDGVSGYEVHNREVRWSDGVPGETTVPCPDGKVATGGGFVAEGIRGGSADVTESAPVFDAASGTATGWQVKGTGVGEANVKSWVMCAAVN